MDAELKVDGDDSFILGANSSIMPSKLTNGAYVMAMNIINRGGVAQTRPGSASLPFEIEGTNVQGITLFTPSTGPACLVFMIDGLVYNSPYPFTTYSQINGLAFSPYSKMAAWASCVQSTDYRPNGTIRILPVTRNILIIQDGITRAGMWDGSEARHLNPTSSDSEFTLPNLDETPVGLWMKWSNNRLWVSRKGLVFASDLGNPLKFHDAQFIAETRASYLPGECTGIAETPDQEGIICFTSSTGTLIKTSIQDRATWLNTPDFQKTIMPQIGCVAPRSIISQYGLIWWWCQKGMINQNDALRQNVSSRLDVQDQEMASSKANISYDVSGVAGAAYENFILHAVPNGEKGNSRIHVLDQAPIDGEMINSWPSYWEGWRPVEFARGLIGTQERIFAISNDYDGEIRIWELFKPDRTDNGIPITCYLETRPHFFGNRDYKRFKYAELELTGLSGATALLIAAAGLRGGYQKVGSKDISAINGQIYHDVLYGSSGSDLFGSRRQTRIVRTQDGSTPSECNATCVESPISGLIDKAFSLLIVWSGVAGIAAYRIFSHDYPNEYRGVCEEDETGQTRLLTSDGCSSNELISDKESFETFLATATYSRISPTSGLTVSHTATQDSKISQVDADRKASQMAKYFVQLEIGELV